MLKVISILFFCFISHGQKMDMNLMKIKLVAYWNKQLSSVIIICLKSSEWMNITMYKCIACSIKKIKTLFIFPVILSYWPVQSHIYEFLNTIGKKQRKPCNTEIWKNHTIKFIKIDKNREFHKNNKISVSIRRKQL